MGVPKFYRWLSERYPCLSEVVKEHQIPEFDNLYLDMNGIIHNCSHPNDDDPHFRITEEKIFSDIFHYIEVLFRMIQPKKVFFMAIDGVAPRAKMNQQRGRRFRSAKEAELNEKRARDKGEELPKEARFDSNCITPGTPFMCRLHDQLKYFVTMKISTDSLWQNVKVILSGHETPGEGEHKIMDFIRFEKSKQGYDPNIRHCLYGLDADLVMLGLCTHDPHFSLLREEVRFGGKKTAQKRTVTPENTTFHLLHLSLLREYIDHEFGQLKQPGRLEFGYDLESIIDDWILMGFLVGNDFLPHLPQLHINKGALSELFDTYKRTLPSMGGYMNMKGTLNLQRFELFLRALSEKERDRFEDIYADAKWIEGKTSKKVQGSKSKVITDTPGPAHVEELLGVEVSANEGWEIVSHNKKDSDLMRLLQSADDFLLDDTSSPTDLDEASDSEATGQDDSGRDKAYQIEFRQHKREYYIQKLGYDNVTAQVLNEQAEVYVLAIQWNLHYYYDGCVSWSWYYPHHYAPWISDVQGFTSMKMEFDLGEPFLPFEQLLSVLPAASKDLLPPSLQSLMTNPDSPIYDFYPKDFESDLNGKQQEWEAVVLIPFIDEKKLQEIARPMFERMNADEKSRNKHGPMLAFEFCSSNLGTYAAPQYFRPVDRNFASCQEIWRKEWEVARECLQKGLMAGVKLDVYFPGFPTLKHIPHTARLKKEGVKVFEQASRGDNMMLYIEDQGNPSIEEVANQLLNAEIWVSWPHMVEARVASVQNNRHIFRLGKDGRQICEENSRDSFVKEGHAICDQYKGRYGIVVGDTHIVVNANVMSGRKYVCGKEGRITLEKIWSKTTQSFALQTTRKDILVHDPSFTQYRTLPELYPNGSTCFVMAESLYGCQATVLKIDEEHKGRVQLSLLEPTEPSFDAIRELQKKSKAQYYPGYKAARFLGINSYLLSRITGTMFVIKGPKEADMEHASKVNIGLNLKNNKRGEEVCGFTRKTNDNNWLYSSKALEAIRTYMSLYPEVFEYLSTNDRIKSDYFHESDIFYEDDGTDRLKELVDWIKEQPFATASRQPCGTETLDENIIASIEEEVQALAQSDPVQKKVVLQLKPHLIHKPSLFKGCGAPDPDADYFLFDRVVNVREGFSVPLGLRGTVIGVLKAARQEDSLIEVIFDEEFHGGQPLRTNSNKSYRVPRSALINITYGSRKLTKIDVKSISKPMAVVQPISEQKRPTGKPVSSTRSKESSPAIAAKHVTPPDARSLPTPDFFSGKPFATASNAGPRADPAFDMNQLWSSLQQNNASILPPPMAAAGNMNPTVEQFFAQHQQASVYQRPPPPPPKSHHAVRPPPPTPGGHHAVQPPMMAAATNFVPLQVSIRKSKPNGRGGHSTQPRDEPDRSAHNGPPPPPPYRGQHRGRGRGRGQPPRPKGGKMAANFSPST